MENNTGSTGKSDWWRWVALPFAAILGAMLCAFIISILQAASMFLFGGFSTDSVYSKYILPIFSSAIFGWIYVLITLNVAPRGKLIAAVVMITILGVISVVTQAHIWISPEYSLGYAIHSAIAALVTIGTSIMALALNKDDYRH